MIGSAGSRFTTRWPSTKTQGTRSPVAGKMKDSSKPTSSGPGAISPIPIEIAPAQAEVPLPDHAGVVARVFEHFGQGVAAGLDDQARVAGQHAGAGLAPGILAGEQGVARRRAGGAGGVRVGEADARSSGAVDVGGLDAGSAVAGDVAVAEIVGIHIDDIGAAGRGRQLASALPSGARKRPAGRAGSE